MTRRECENAVLDKLEEIRCIVNEYGLNSACIGFDADFAYVFELNEDQNGAPISGDYLLHGSRWTEQEEG